MARARVADIVAIAARLSHASVEALMGPGRHRSLTRIRHAVYYASRANGHSYPQIGARLNKNHSTVIHGVEQAMALSQRDDEYAAFLFKLLDEAAQSEPFIRVSKKVTMQIEDLPEPPKALRPTRSDPKPVKVSEYFQRSVKPKNDFGADQFVVGRARW